MNIRHQKTIANAGQQSRSVMKTYGYFSEKKFIITDRNTPRHWYNYMFNDEYVTFVSQVGFGQGLAQDDMGRRIMPVTDRNIYISDNCQFWQATGLPIHDELQDYRCEHNIGYTDISVVKNGIKSICRFFVPTSGKREIIRVTVENLSDETKTIKVIPFADTNIDNAYSPQGYQTTYAEFYADKNAAVGIGYFDFGGSIGKQFSYLTSNRTVSSFDTRRTAFIGTYGNKQMPKALIENLGCLGTDCIAEKICLALENTLTLKVGEKTSIYYTLGVEDSIDAIPQFTSEELEAQFNQMVKKHSNICGGVRIQTPWENLNNLFNDWLKYQTNMGSRWARVRHNGIRDLTSDTECLSCFQAELASDRLCRVMNYQYANGYAPRTFLDGNIRDNNFSDNMVWMVFAAHAITKELGDTGYLLRETAFNDHSSASVYEHAKRAVDFMWEFTGHHGLVRIWGGDWNDCMNYAGLKGKGVSVWLSIAFVRAAKMLSEMASWLGKNDDAAKYKEYAAAMQDRVNEFGWKDDRFIYAISDDYNLIGAKECKEGSIFALPQLWSVFADFEKQRQTEAMDTLEKELNTDLGLLVSKPPYTEQLPYIGSMTQKYPGLHENGGVYLHAAVWKLAVDSLLGRADKVEEGLRKILPTDNTYFEKCGEPYVMFNSYLGTETGYRAGTPGQSWRTASGQWLLYSIVRFIYGLTPEFDGLKIKPCLPPSWENCSITKEFRGCTYSINFRGAGEVKSITVNGVPHETDKPIVPIDGAKFDIEVILG